MGVPCPPKSGQHWPHQRAPQSSVLPLAPLCLTATAAEQSIKLHRWLPARGVSTMVNMLQCCIGCDTMPSNSQGCTHLLLAPSLLIHLGPPALSRLPRGSLSVNLTPSCLQGPRVAKVSVDVVPWQMEGGTRKGGDHLLQDVCRMKHRRDFRVRWAWCPQGS